MAALSRLTRLWAVPLAASVVWVLLLGFGRSAFAYGPAGPMPGSEDHYRYTQSWDGVDHSATSLSALADMYAARVTQNYDSNCSASVVPVDLSESSQTASYRLHISGSCSSPPSTFDTTNGPYNTSKVLVPGTPPGGCLGRELVDGSCVCPSGFRPDGVTGGCLPYSCLSAGQPVNTLQNIYYGGASSASPRSMCLQGCEIEGVAAGASGGKNYVWGPFTSTGKPCLDVDAPDPQEVGDVGDNNGHQADGNSDPPAEPQCPSGKVPGQVNGNTICVDPGTASAQGPSSSASSPDGTPTSTKIETTCTNGTCTTTTTTTNTSTGQVISTGSKTQTKGDFCNSAEKSTALCSSAAGGGGGSEDPGSFGGSCGGSTGSFQCGGSDAVECAIATEQHRRLCQMWDDRSGSLQSIADAVATGASQPAGHPANNPAVKAWSIDSTDLIASGGGCPADRQFAVASGMPAVMIPFSRLCSAAGYLKLILIGLTALVCVFIVFGVKGGS